MSITRKFASVDIGSNAVRLLFYNIYLDMDNQPVFKKVALTRVPVRLGEDVFRNKIISEKKITMLVKTIQAFKNLMEVHEVVDYRVCATSAMREAINGAEVIEKIRQETGISITVITGQVEADLIYANHIAEKMSEGRSYMYIDVGGGSTELTLFYKGRKRFSESFNIGTVRMLHDKVEREDWEKIKMKCIELSTLYKNITGIGSGGNIIKLQKLAGLPEDGIFSRIQLKDVYNMLRQFSYEERMRKFGLNPDRADVIIPAAEIFLHICKHADIKNIMVPKMGLSDGIIRAMYEEYIQTDPDFLRK